MENEAIKSFLSSIAQDDYIEADKHFPKVVENALNSIINKNKPAIIDSINLEANKIAKESVTTTEE